MHRIVKLCLFVLFFTLILNGCDTQNKIEDVNSDERHRLKVMYFSESSFFKDFGGMFTMKHPNIEIEVLRMNDVFNSTENYYQILDDFIKNHNPDILLLNEESYTKLANEGKLYGLDTMINADQLDIDNMADPIIKILREKGNGQLFGLTPQFSSSALFYNIELFDKYSIPYPTNLMTYEDFFSLVRKFPNNAEEVFGFQYTSSSPFFLFTGLLDSNGVASPIDPLHKKVTVNNAIWKDIFKLSVELNNMGLVHKPQQLQNVSEMEYLKSMYPFIDNKTAMHIGGIEMIHYLKTAKQFLYEEAPTWNIVTTPVVSLENPTHYYRISNIYSISSTAENQEAALALLKFMHSDEIARSLSKTNTTSLVTRVKQIENLEGYDIESFWNLNPQLIEDEIDVPIGIRNQFWIMARPEIEKTFEGSQTIEETLEILQEKGDEIFSNFES